MADWSLSNDQNQVTKTRNKIVLALAKVTGYSTVLTELWTD